MPESTDSPMTSPTRDATPHEQLVTAHARCRTACDRFVRAFVALSDAIENLQPRGVHSLVCVDCGWQRSIGNLDGPGGRLLRYLDALSPPTSPDPDPCEACKTWAQAL